MTNIFRYGIFFIQMIFMTAFKKNLGKFETTLVLKHEQQCLLVRLKSFFDNDLLFNSFLNSSDEMNLRAGRKKSPAKFFFLCFFVLNFKML